MLWNGLETSPSKQYSAEKADYKQKNDIATDQKWLALLVPVPRFLLFIFLNMFHLIFYSSFYVILLSQQLLKKFLFW